jgi:hypothetical protein
MSSCVVDVLEPSFIALAVEIFVILVTRRQDLIIQVNKLVFTWIAGWPKNVVTDVKWIIMCLSTYLH